MKSGALFEDDIGWVWTRTVDRLRLLLTTLQVSLIGFSRFVYFLRSFSFRLFVYSAWRAAGLLYYCFIS